MAAWQWVFTSPGITSLPRQSNSRSPGCAARNSAAAVSDSVTSAIRLPSTPTQPAKVRGAFPTAVIGSTVAFEKRIAIACLSAAQILLSIICVMFVDVSYSYIHFSFTVYFEIFIYWAIMMTMAAVYCESKELKYKLIGVIPAINAVILGVNKKKAREIDGKLPVRVRPVFYDMGRYTTLFFELDE